MTHRFLRRGNVFGLLNVTRAVLPIMRNQKSGHIINVSSVGGYSAGYPGFGVYCATKFAVEGITESLHAEVTPLGIRVTVIEPGFIRTDFLDSSSLVKTALELPAYAETVARHVPSPPGSAISSKRSSEACPSSR